MEGGIAMRDICETRGYLPLSYKMRSLEMKMTVEGRKIERNEAIASDFTLLIGSQSSR
jgi:hypothetical protein